MARSHTRVLLAVVPLLPLAACSQDTTECTEGRGAVAGTPADYVAPAREIAGAQVAAPVLCPDNDGQPIAVTGGGDRRFGFAGAGCTSPVASDAGEPCATANIDAFFAQLRASLQQAEIRDLGSGIGACGADLPGGAHVHIDDWRLAGDTVRVVAEELGRWQLGDTMGVLVAGIVIACVH